MLLICYAVSTVIALLLMLRHVPDSKKRANYLNTVTIANSIVNVALTIACAIYVAQPSYFFNRYLVIDQLSVYEVLVASVIFSLSSCYARGYVRQLAQSGEIAARELRLFYAVYNLLLMVVVFAFYSNNTAFFWILLELTTILSAILIVTLNAKENIVAALKYVFTASTAMLFSVIGLIILFAITKQATGTGTLNWDELLRQANALPRPLFIFSFILIFVGFASKAGIVPFHTWLPQAHAKAPSVISVLLSAVLLNIGIFGILRLYAVAHVTTSWHTISTILIVFGMLSIAIAALSMLPRGNVKKLVAFSSIEHMGFILVGIGLGTPLAIFWVLFHTLAHALVKTLLFFSSGILHQQYHSNQFEDMKDIFRLQPLASWGLVIGSVAIIGLPMFPVFLSKLYILTQLTNFGLWAVFVVLIFFLIVAAAFAMLLIKTSAQKAEYINEPYKPSLSMKAPIILLLAGILVLGIYFPSGLRDVLNGIVKSLGF
jgi:hydrogenase-4 component F